MSTPVSILLLGKIPTHLKAVSDIVQPEGQVIQIASSVDDAIDALPPLLSEKKIDVIIMGGGFSPADFEKVNGVDGAKSVPWMRPDPQSIQAAGGKPPAAEDVAARLKKGLDAKLENLREGKGAGEVWYF